MIERSEAVREIVVRYAESETPHIGSDCIKMLASQRELAEHLAALNGAPLALVRNDPAVGHEGELSDIDNSFRNSDGTNTLDSMYLFYRSRERGYPIGFVTGNDLVAVVRRAQAGNLPFAEIEMVQAGMQIHFLHTLPNGDKIYVKDLGFEQALASSGYDRLSIAERADKMIEYHLTNSPSLKLNFQKPDEEHAFIAGKDKTKTDQPYKLSFFAFALPENREALLAEIRKWIPDESVDLMICEEIGWGSKNPDSPIRYWCIDALAKTKEYGSGKAAAITRVCKLTGIDYGIMIVDSGNDTPVYDLGADLTGIVPVVAGGARTEMREKTVELARNAIGDNANDPRNKYLDQVLTLQTSQIPLINSPYPPGKFMEIIDSHGTPKLVYVGLSAIGPRSGRIALNRLDIARQLRANAKE